MRRTRCCGRTFLCNAVITSSNFAKLAIIFKHNLFYRLFLVTKPRSTKKECGATISSQKLPTFATRF